MKNSRIRLLSRTICVAAIIVGFTATPIDAQELPIAEARPGPVFGTPGDDGLSLPTDVAIGAKGRVYVVDSGHHRVVYYDGKGNQLGYFGTKGKKEGELQGPVGIATASDGNIYVADRGNQRLQIFTADGKFRHTMTLLEEGVAVTPVGVAVTDRGKSLFVTASNSHRVLSVDRKGNIRTGWGGKGKEPGQFKYPATLAVDANSNILVVDVLNQRIQMFSTDGTIVASFGKLGAKPGTFIRPKGIAVADNGQVFVSDSYLGVVQVFTSTGELIGVLGTNGEAARFETPVGLAFAAGRLYITDMLAGKVLSYDMESGR